MKGKVDVKKLKTSLKLHDYEKIIKDLGIPIFSKGEHEWRLWTGEKHKDPYQGSPKLYFYTDSKMFVSYTSACTMDIIGLCQRRLNVLGQQASFMDAVNFILASTGLDTTALQRINKPNICNWEESFGKFIRFRQNQVELKTYPIETLDLFYPEYPQAWVDEGISIDTMEKFKIGYYPRLWQAVIPCFNKDGGLIGIRARNLNPEFAEQAKYIPFTDLAGTTYKFPTNEVFYGMNFNWLEIERTGTVFLGESEKFVMKMDTWFGEKSTALGMFGSNLGLKRRNMLIKMGVQRVVYVADCDYIGQDEQAFNNWRDKVNRLVQMFAGMAKVEVVWDSDMGLLGPKDNATDKNLETWNKLYKVREIF